jgi:predicted O-methyltransferase YrrM
MKTNTAWVSESEKAHGNNWREWLGHLKDTPALGLEVGTWMGESAEWMLREIFTHPESRYVCVDTFEGSEEHHLAGIDCDDLLADTTERLSSFGDRSVIIKGFSDQVLRNYHGSPLDFGYVDASHDSMNVLRDSVLMFDLIKIGGIMIFDDYTWNVMPDPVDCPALAIDGFVAAYARRLEIIGMGYQFAVRKIA